ncbi:MAG: hypothetical protein AKCLJLPJ_02595 [Fimbriimonadales bacterium]|nr:hypothetical protein [Fimbriimonadales bacterium]
MRFLMVFITVAAACAVVGQDWAKARLDASPRHMEWVSVKSGAREVKCFVAYPEKKEKTAAIILIHEIMGMTEWVMSVADQIAEAGYIAIAPDFLSGMGPNGGRTTDFADVGKVREAISGLPAQQVISDLNAACDYALTLPSCNGKIAVGGFCWGGTQTFRFATERKDLKAAFVFYGTGPTDASAIAKIACPVYGFYGGNDNRVNATIPDSEKLMKEAGKTYQPAIYEGAGHGFMRAGEQPGGSAENVKAREEAWTRWKSILEKL